MTFMCSISPSNAEITRDESKDVIFVWEFNFDAGKRCGRLTVLLSPKFELSDSGAVPDSGGLAEGDRDGVAHSGD